MYGGDKKLNALTVRFGRLGIRERAISEIRVSVAGIAIEIIVRKVTGRKWGGSWGKRE